MSAVKPKEKGGGYEAWLWSLSQQERTDHFAAVKKIVASHIKRKESA